MVIAVGFILVIIIIPCITMFKMVRNHIPMNQYTGAIVGRFQMIKLNTAITERLTGGMYMESNEVLLGKDGWLFYKVMTDGTPLYDYMGINHFSDNELETILGNMERFSKLSKERGFKLAFLTVPNKEQVYSEYMPDTVVKINDSSRLSELTEYMETVNNDIFIYIDMTDDFDALKNSYPLYYKTDTHWTEVGSFVALQEVLLKLYGEKMDVSQVRFDKIDGFEGDLPRISGTQDRFGEANYKLVENEDFANYKQNEKLLVIGDSFGDAMLHTARYFYDEVKWVRIKDYSNDILDEYAPDTVIVDCVERYLPDLLTYNLAGM